MHRHACEFGHSWECGGKAARPLTGHSELTVCMCMDHGVPMEDADHSECTVELLACPEHCDEQLRAMGYEPGTSNMPQAPSEEAGHQWHDQDGKPIVGFCLLCGKDYYTYDEFETHNASESECAPFRALKEKERLRLHNDYVKGMKNMSATEKMSAAEAPTPSTGIFWLYRGKLLIACTPLTESEEYGECLTSPHAHIDLWEELRQNGSVQREDEYDECARGRVVYDTVQQKYFLYADPCILSEQRYVDAIVKLCGLSYEQVEKKTDPHYRCPNCLPASGIGDS
jgi:hypothetical protein